MTKALQPGDEIRCPHCRGWHPVKHLHTEGTDYTVKMLYFECRAGHYYAGQLGTVSRHQTRWSYAQPNAAIAPRVRGHAEES